jgi:GNAT superfamily N-acetyltransferase
MPELRFIPTRELPRELKCQILSFIRIEWWPIFRDGDRFWDFTEKPTHPVNAVLTERGLVISHAEVNWRMVEHAGQAFKVYGVSAVFTYPAFRREGYGSRLMAAVSDYLRASDADLAILFCQPQRVRFYEAAGWEWAAGARFAHGDPQHPQTDDLAACLLFVSPRGRAARTAFCTEPVYIGLHPW